MNAPADILAALVPVAEALDRIGAAFYVGGSVASSVHGAPRSTLDVDLVADLRADDARPLAGALRDAYYVDEVSIAEAIARRSSFNVIHLASGVKVDVFVAKAGPYDREALARRVQATLGADAGARALPVATPEDTVLAKLDWFERGGRVSERQWSDILGVLRVKAGVLDLAYLRRWAPVLDVGDLLDRALAEAASAP